MTNEELALMLVGVRDDVKEIKAEARLTNGRLKTMELWRARISGAWFAVSLLGPVITALIVKYV